MKTIITLSSFLKQSALFILSSTSLDYMMKLSVWEGGITLAKVQIKVNDNGSFRVTGTWN